MEDFQLVKCPSCGSSVIESKSESIAECSHCGSKLLIKNKSKLPIKGVLSLLLLVLITIIATSWKFYNNAPQDTKSEISKPTNEVTKALNKNNTLKVKFNMPKIDTEEMRNVQINYNENKYTSIEQPKITIISQVEGATINGGVFWIVVIRNDSTRTVMRPGVVISLFNDEGIRIEEQKGWAKLGYLLPGKQTEALVFIANFPEKIAKSEMVAVAKFASEYDTFPEDIEVLNFVVNSKNGDNNSKNVSIVGDVINNYNFQVDFVNVVAVAKDINGTAIGLADAFVTHSSMPAKTQSGFKVTTGTFIAKPPASWSLWAIGRKHKNKK